MNLRLGRLCTRVGIGVGAVTLALLGLPGATASVAGGSPSASIFTLTKTSTTVTIVGTTTWTQTGAAGPTGSQTGSQGPPGTYKLTPAAAKASFSRVPDVGVSARNSTIAAAPGSKHTGGAAPAHGATAPSASPGQVTGPTAGLTSVPGSNGYDQGVLHPVYTKSSGTPLPLPGLDVEPPDQGLCAGNGYVMEMNNMVVQLFHSATMTPLSPHGMAVERLFDAPEVFGAANTGSVSVQGDPRCYYDPSSNRWFASQIWLTEADHSSTFKWAGEFVAASTTTKPTGSWHVYFIPDQFNAQGIDGCNNGAPSTLPTTTNLTGTSNPCYGDQPLLGVNGNAVFISTNEYTLAGNKIVGGVANEYALSKADLLKGTASPIYWNHLGDTVAEPGNPTCPYFTPRYGQTNPQVICPWYSIAPAVSASDVTTTTGTFYAASNVTFTTSGGHQVAVWKFTHTDAVTTGGTHITGSVAIATTVAYKEPPTSPVRGALTLNESLATQEQGTHPLGTLWKSLFGVTPIKWNGGEGMIATNTDRVTTAAYDPANGSVWAAVNTGTESHGKTTAGIAWFRVTPTGTGPSLTATDEASGYVSAPAVNDFFPSISFTNSGKGIMDYVISGTGYFPSTGYSIVGATGPTRILHIARAGVGPEDGFSEYTATYDRPRFGDYSTAAATGTTFYFASEMVNQTCSVRQFKATFTCGGTRDLQANFGTSVNKLTA
jgi:hypothetical protein